MKKKMQIVIALAGILLIVIGINQGDYLDVLNKAIHICLECIGIG